MARLVGPAGAPHGWRKRARAARAQRVFPRLRGGSVPRAAHFSLSARAARAEPLFIFSSESVQGKKPRDASTLFPIPGQNGDPKGARAARPRLYAPYVIRPPNTLVFLCRLPPPTRRGKIGEVSAVCQGLGFFCRL